MDFSNAVDLAHVNNEGEPQIRVLVCRNCKTLDELPDWDGDPRHDVLLQLVVDKHQKPDPHVGLLFKFPVKYWVVPKVRDEIIKQIRGGSEGLDAFQTKFYETRSMFGEDAMTCFKEHNRPKGQCPDYKSDKKLLKPDTNAERKDAGLDKYERSGGPKIYLCDFCPVKSFNMHKFNKEKGLDK